MFENCYSFQVSQGSLISYYGGPDGSAIFRIRFTIYEIHSTICNLRNNFHQYPTWACDCFIQPSTTFIHTPRRIISGKFCDQCSNSNCGRGSVPQWRNWSPPTAADVATWRRNEN